MRKIYFLPLTAFCFFSCGVSVKYLGNTFEKTSRVDVYVDPVAIKRKYTVIGKGYEHRIYGLRYNVERIQEKAVEVAKQKGADAVLFQDHQYVQPGTAISTVSRTDTLDKAVITTGNTHIGPVVYNGRHILFLKYD